MEHAHRRYENRVEAKIFRFVLIQNETALEALFQISIHENSSA